MNTIADIDRRMILHEAFLLSVEGALEVNPRVLNQKVVDCMHDDLSDINFMDDAVQAFFYILRDSFGFTVESTLYHLKDSLQYIFASDTSRHFSLHCDKIESMSNGLHSGVGFKEVSRLLEYLGCKDLSECYRQAKSSHPEFEVRPGNEISEFSLGVNYLYLGGDSTTNNLKEDQWRMSEYKSSSIDEIIYKARFILEKELLDLLEMDSDMSGETACNVNRISIFLNGKETLTSDITLSAYGAYHLDLNMRDRVKDASITSSSDFFRNLLMKGTLFSGVDGRSLTRILKGRMLENDLGM